MLFSSLTFLLIYLPLTVILYYSIPRRSWRNILLLCSSLIFYSWGEPKTIILMLIEIGITYWIGIQIEKSISNKTRKLWLIIEIIIILSFLFVFKYYNFFFVNLFRLSFLSQNIVLPIGISFYSFQILSYAVDVYRKEVCAQRSIINLALYVCLFPQLIAGPIVRYQTIANELSERNENIEDFTNGVRRFIVGLAKKITIANHLAIVSDLVFNNANLNTLPNFICWIGAISFMFQIYYDFSGYSDMAIGLGRMFGFHFLENFNYPYISKSITEFWRRWHISLSTWFRDYVYIPLGGSRVPRMRWIFNIAIVWGLTGLWHGAAANFVLWGAYYGTLLIVEKLFAGKWMKRLPVINWAITMFLVLIGWVLFNAPSSSSAMIILSKMFQGFSGFSRMTLNNMNILYLWPYYVIALIGAVPWKKIINYGMRENEFFIVIYDIYLILIFCICLMFLVNNSYNPFIYFRF